MNTEAAAVDEATLTCLIVTWCQCMEKLQESDRDPGASHHDTDPEVSHLTRQTTRMSSVIHLNSDVLYLCIRVITDVD